MTYTKLLSKILYPICLFLACFSGLIVAYAWACKLLNLNIQQTEGQEIVSYPFTDTPFLILDATSSYWLFSFLMPLLFYAVFFLFLAQVFKVFLQPRLFIQSSINHLRRFYLHNLVTPIILVILASFFVAIETPLFFIIALHFFLGVFVFFLSEIFKQGLNLQNEQDLYI